MPVLCHFGVTAGSKPAVRLVNVPYAPADLLPGPLHGLVDGLLDGVLPGLFHGPNRTPAGIA